MKQLLVLVYTTKGLSLFKQNQSGQMTREHLRGELYLSMPNNKQADELISMLEYVELSRIINSESLVKLVYSPDIKVDLLEKIMIFLIKHSSNFETLTIISVINLFAVSMDSLAAKEWVLINIHGVSYYAQYTKDGFLSLCTGKVSQQKAKCREISEEELSQTFVHSYVRRAIHTVTEEKDKIISNLELKLQTEQEKNKLLQIQQSQSLSEFDKERDIFSRIKSIEMITFEDIKAVMGTSEMTNKSSLRLLVENGAFVKKNQPVIEITCGNLNITKKTLKANEMGRVCFHIAEPAGMIKKGEMLLLNELAEVGITGNDVLCSILSCNKKAKDTKDSITLRRSIVKDNRKKI